MLREFLAIRVLDVLDILLVTILVYTTMVWSAARRRASWPSGHADRGGLYVVARALASCA